MANKLYEETHIQAIANAIREKNGSADTYTVAQMGDAIRDIETGGTGGGSGTEENRMVFTGTISDTIKGSGLYAVVAQDTKLADIRNNTNLLVRVEFDIAPTPYTVVRSWATNDVHKIPMSTNTQYQYIHRYGSDGSDSYNTATSPLNTGSPSGVGFVQITSNGELRCYSNSSNYAIRPSKYTVIVEW